MNRSILTILALFAPAALAQDYRLIDLGTFRGESEAFGLNQAAAAALGYSVAIDFHYDAASFVTSPTPLPAQAGFSEHIATGADAQGRVYGFSYTFGRLDSSSFMYDGSTLVPLGAFECRDANAAGELAGTTRVTPGGFVFPRAARWSGGSLATLPTLGGESAHAFGIADDSSIVGNSALTSGGAARPCLWINSTPRDLGTLGGASGEARARAAEAIVGSSQTAQGAYHATRWTVAADGSVLSRTDLGALRPNTTSYAYDINAAGDIVGSSTFHAVIWQNGAISDLNARIASAPNWVLNKAWAIGDSGAIVGRGSYFGVPRAFMLLPCGGQCCDPDVNCDGAINGFDIEATEQAVNGDFTNFCQATADLNGDGAENGFDIETEEQRVNGAPC
ncbi:hypothetical protein PHYC_01987 [Phycisphaerales bacterium]|nr:hypothetical protein PHYC_01987 [Phycisphaerales bacterium]